MSQEIDVSAQGAREDGPLLVTPKEAAKLLGVCPRTVTRMCERGELKAIRVRSLWRINRAALVEYARGGR